MHFRWRYLIVGVLTLVVILAVAENIFYNLIFIPTVRAAFENENESLLENKIDYGDGHLTILAPLAFRSDCKKTYYGCFNWQNFPGADVVVSFQGGSAQKYAIRVDKNCVDERCVLFKDFSARGYFIDSSEAGIISRNFNTDIECKEFIHEYIIQYQVSFCSALTNGYGKIVTERRYAKIQSPMFGRFLLSVDYKIFFNVIANYGTRKVYLLEGW